MVARIKDEYVTIAEAADIVGVAQSTIRRWIREERIPAYRLGDRRITLKRDDLRSLYSPLHPTDRVDDLQNIPPMSDQERRDALQVLRTVETFREELIRKRGGKPFRPAAEVIREMRDERTRELP